MFIPLRDQLPLQRVRAPHVTRAIILAAVVAWIVFDTGWWADPQRTAVMAGTIPAVLWGQAVLPPGYDLLPAWSTLLTSLFLHASLLHLVGNMLFLQVFGDNVEDALGHGRFLAFYLACGVAGGLAHALSAPGSAQPLIGASGAVAGVVAAYLVLYPRSLVWGLALNIIPVRINAVWMLGLWAAFQLFHALSADDPSTAWWAHVGGFCLGLALVPLLRQRAAPAPVEP